MKLEIIKGDITTLKVDAIVNAANNHLAGGGGVDGAIHAAAGPELNVACRKIGYCNTGDACLTKGFNLPAKYIIHTVGPVWHGGNKNEMELLISCYLRCLEIACQNNFESVAFPSISTGAYGYPLEKAAKVAIDTIMDYLKNNSIPNLVTMVCFSEEAKNIYSGYYQQNYFNV